MNDVCLRLKGVLRKHDILRVKSSMCYETILIGEFMNSQLPSFSEKVHLLKTNSEISGNQKPKTIGEVTQRIGWVLFSQTADELVRVKCVLVLLRDLFSNRIPYFTLLKIVKIVFIVLYLYCH